MQYCKEILRNYAFNLPLSEWCSNTQHRLTRSKALYFPNGINIRGWFYNGILDFVWKKCYFYEVLITLCPTSFPKW